MLTFEPITNYESGTIAFILFQCYTELLRTDWEHWEGEQEKWLEFDRNVFDNPGTVGRCVFATCLNGEIIGFGSFNPRKSPEFGIVGHNCILPQFRRKGYGKQQVLEILNRLRSLGAKKAVVTTSEHPFFLPARKMYHSCGFHETRRFAEGPDPRHMMIEYERELR